MKSNNKNIGIIKNFKWIMIIPIVLLVMAIIFGCVFGLNYDYDFQNISTFDVKFGTTVTEKEYKELTTQLNEIIKENFNDYRLEKIGEGADNGLIVKIVNNDGTLNQKIADLKTTIEDSLVTKCGDTIVSPMNVTTSDTTTILPKDISELIGYSVLAIVCIMVFAFVYFAIRYNFVSSVSFVLTILFELAMLTIVMIVARIPFNYYFVVSYFVMIISTLFVSTYINNYIRSNLNIEKYSKYSNSDRVYDAFRNTFKPIIIFTTLIMLSLFAIMFFGNLSLLYTIISIMAGIIVTMFSVYTFEFSLWSFWYKKDKDTALKRRIELDKKKALADNKTDEKIVV